MKSQPNYKSAGFSLIEQMIVVAIIGILASQFLNMYLQAKRFEEDHYRFTLATTVLQKEMEYVKTSTTLHSGAADEKTIGEAVKEDLSRLEDGNIKVTVSNLSGVASIKRVEVTVEWKNPWGQKRFLKSVILRPK